MRASRSTAPILKSVSASGPAPVITNFIGTGASYTLDVSLAGTIYILVNTTSTAIPNSTVKSTVLAAGGTARYSGATVAGSNGFSVTGTFTPSTTYYLHAVAETAGVLSAADVIASYFEPAVVTGPVLVASSKLEVPNFPTGTIVKPSGTVNGNLMVMKLGIKAQAIPVTPTGWTVVGSDVINGPSNTGVFVYSRVAATEPADYALDMGAYYGWSVIISTYSGASALANMTTTRNTFTQNLTGPTITATGNSIVETTGCFDQDTITAPGSTTLIQQTTTAGGYIGMTCVYEGPLTAGVTTARTFSGSAIGSSAVVLVLEIKV